MKIVHVCLTGPYTDNLSYQDNLLSKYHKKMGYDVVLIAPRYSYDAEGLIVRDNREHYINDYGIKIIRLENKYNTNIKSKFKCYRDIYKTVETEKPDILFIHGVQFLDVKEVVRYIKNYPTVKVYADNHADFSNSATNWLSKNILHKIVWKYYAQLLYPFTTRFYGVLPARVDFLIDMYNISEEKTELLVMGADDEMVREANYLTVKEKFRKRFNLKKNDFLIVTGGKIDCSKKQVLNLMNVIVGMNNSNIKLIVFGSVIPDMQEEVYKLAENDSIRCVGWVDDEQSYQLFSAADLVVFPGRHSVYWEQVVALGKPMVVKYWEGTTHIDLGENCKFLYKDTEEEISNILSEIILNRDEYNKMLNSAESEKRKQFLYSNIARKSINT